MGSERRRSRPATGSWDGVIWGLCVVGLFSSFVLVSKWGLRSAFEPLDLLAIRFSVAGTVLLPIFLRYKLMGLKPLVALKLAITGGFGFAVCAYGGFALAPASHGSSLIHGTLPLTTLMISLVVFKESSGFYRLAGALVIAAGILLLVADSLMEMRTSQVLGDAFLLAASLSWSTYGILVRRTGIDAIPAAAMVAVLSASLILPIYIFFGDISVLIANAHEVITQALFQGLAIGILSLIAYTRAVSILGTQNTAIFAAAAPALTTLLSIPLLNEAATVMAWFGVACVTVGIAGTSWLVGRRAS